MHIYWSATVLSGVLFALASPTESAAETNCFGVVKKNIASREVPEARLMAGETFDYITQYWEVTGDPTAYLCQKGGFCYPAAKIKNDQVQTLIELKNCGILPKFEESYGESLHYLSSGRDATYSYFESRLPNDQIRSSSISGARSEFEILKQAFNSLSPKNRVKLQSRLSTINVYDGVIDGQFGKRTYNALIAAERLMESAGFGFGWKADPEVSHEFLAQIMSDSWADGVIACDSCD